MDFLDKSGHIFSLPSYSEEPIGYDFEENAYVFWLSNSNGQELSINNYYIRIINAIIYYNDIDNIPFNELVDVSIEIDSNKFWLLNPEDIQKLVNDNKNIFDYISIDEKSEENGKFIKKLTTDDLLIVTLDEHDDTVDERKSIFKASKMAIIPIYVIGTSNEPGTWMTNILIHVSNHNEDYDVIDEDYCPITVGGVYNEENEILTINGQNMGVKLPHNIFKAVYQNSYYNDEFDEQLYNEKLKEYLLNYMDLKGEIGNYNSLEKSIKWFGYGDKISLSKLLKTDNEFKTQYIHDYLNIQTDILKSFKSFTNNANITLKIKENTESDKCYNINFNDTLFGEGKPIAIDNFGEIDITQEGLANDKWNYLKPYYDFSINELALKLSCLKYYYEKYFLPIHTNIHSATISHLVFGNDIKFNNNVYNTVQTEYPVMMEGKFEVEFETDKYKYFTEQYHIVDEYFNEFKDINTNQDMYEIDDTCLNIGIKFNNYDDISKYYNCVLLLEKELDQSEISNPYMLTLYGGGDYDKSFFNPMKYDIKIYDNNKKSLNLNSYLYSLSLDGKSYSEYVYGYDNFLEYYRQQFCHKIVSSDYSEESKNDYDIEVGFDKNTGNNTYTINIDKLLNKDIINNDDIDALNDYISVNDNSRYIILSDNSIELITNNNRYIYIPSIKELNKNVVNPDDIYGYIVVGQPIYLRMMFDQTDINDFVIVDKNEYNKSISLRKYVHINFQPISKLVYESHFGFVQNMDDESTIYNSFVLYPKLLNRININYFIDQKFIIRLLVNNRWYIHEFYTKMPDVLLEFGTIKYKYWLTSDNYYSRFAQLCDIKPNKYDEDGNKIENGYIKFNSYLYEPDFININSINYLSDIEQYIIKNNLSYIDEESLSKYINFNKYITIGVDSVFNGIQDDINFTECNIYFSDQYFDSVENIYIPFDYIDNKHDIYIANDHLMFTCTKDAETTYKIENINLLSGSNHRIDDKIDMKIDAYDPSFNSSIRISKHNDDNFYIYIVNDLGESKINQTFATKVKIYNTNTNLYQNYNYKINVTNPKYLNNVYVYDLFAKNDTKKDVLIFNRNITVSANGIVFSHSNTTPNKFYLDGKTIWTNQVIHDMDLRMSGDFENDNDGKDYNIDSRIIDKYGFYWGSKIFNSYTDGILNHKLETICGSQTLRPTYFYYYCYPLSSPVDSKIYTYTSELNVGKCDISNFGMVNSDYFSVNNDKITYNSYLNQDIIDYTKLNIYFDSTGSKFKCHYDGWIEDKDVIAKISYINMNNNQQLDWISNNDYLLLKDENTNIDDDHHATDIKIQLSFFIKYQDTYTADIIYVNYTDVQYDLNNNPFVEVNDERVYVQTLYEEYDQRNGGQKIPDADPKNYIWSYDTIINLDTNKQYVTDSNKLVEYINTYIDGHHQLGMYWNDNTEPYLNEYNEDAHEKIYLQKDLMPLLSKEYINTFELAYDSSAPDIIKCEVFIEYIDGSHKVVTIDNPTFELTSNCKSATLYFVIVTHGNREDEIHGYITPHIYLISNEYIPVKYDVNLDDVNLFEFNFDNIRMLADYNMSDKVCDMYNDFFKSTIFDKSLGREIDENVYDAERLYNIEKNYNIWIKSHSLIYDDSNNPDFTLKCNTIFNTIKYNYMFLDDDIKAYFELHGYTIDMIKDMTDDQFNSFIRSLPSQFKNRFIVTCCYKYPEEDMSNEDKTSYINLCRFDFAKKEKLNYYDVEVWENGKQLKVKDYIFNDNFVKIIRQNIKFTDKILDYDLYLMHDLKQWYIVFISKETLDKVYTYDELEIDDELKVLKANINEDSGKPYINNTKYELHYRGSCQTFLINRMQYVSKEGINHFKDDEMIVGSIKNNKYLPVNIYGGTKWHITPMSIGMNKDEIMSSNAELAIFSLPMNNNKYQHGYYTVDVQYCLDRNMQHQFRKTGRFRVE